MTAVPGIHGRAVRCSVPVASAWCQRVGPGTLVPVNCTPACSMCTLVHNRHTSMSVAYSCTFTCCLRCFLRNEIFLGRNEEVVGDPSQMLGCPFGESQPPSVAFGFGEFRSFAAPLASGPQASTTLQRLCPFSIPLLFGLRFPQSWHPGEVPVGRAVYGRWCGHRQGSRRKNPQEQVADAGTLRPEIQTRGSAGFRSPHHLYQLVIQNKNRSFQAW